MSDQFAALAARVEAVEAQLRGRSQDRLDVQSLPIMDLRAALETSWQPAADTFLLPHSVGNDSLSDNAVDSRVIAADAVGTSEIGGLPKARVFNSAALAINNAATTALTFDSERWDSGTTTEQHSVGALTGRLTCQVAGLYAIGAALEWANNAVGDIRNVGLRLNGATFIGVQSSRPITGAVYSNQFTVSTQYQLVVGDYVEVTVHQNSGGALNVNAAGNYSPEFWWEWMND